MAEAELLLWNIWISANAFQLIKRVSQKDDWLKNQEIGINDLKVFPN